MGRALSCSDATAVASGRHIQAHLTFNVLSIAAVDLDLPFDSRIGLGCWGPVVRAFRPEWDRRANPSSGEPPARKTVLWHREAACNARASRARALPAATGAPSPAQTAHAADGDHAHGAPARMSWARLLRRVFDIDVERCACGGKLKMIAAIEAPALIERMLTHLGLSAQPPPRTPARRIDLYQAA